MAQQKTAKAAAPAVRATFDGFERAIVARGRTVTIPHPTETIARIALKVA
jgi:hypothetical protein